MTDIFIKVIEMSMTASIVIGVVMVLRLFLRKVPKLFSYVLWAAALFRLLCPISFELPSAPIPSVEIPYSAEVDMRNADGLFITHTDSEISPVPDNYAPQMSVSPQVTAVSEPVPETPVKREINYIAAASYIWALAVIIMAFRGVFSWARLSRSLRSAQKMGGNVYVSPATSDPFIMGIIRPRIYLPTGLSCTESDLIIRHEKAHMHRGDHIAKLVMYIALCIHCFNPLVWLMFRLFERDMEMSCDEKVTANMTKEQKADYSQTLLKISAKPTAAFTACFGESGTKQRIKNVLSFKKPAVWVVIVLTVAAIVVSVVLCANRNKSIDTDIINDTFPCGIHDSTYVEPTLKNGIFVSNNENLLFIVKDNSIRLMGDDAALRDILYKKFDGHITSANGDDLTKEAVEGELTLWKDMQEYTISTLHGITEKAPDDSDVEGVYVVVPFDYSVSKNLSIAVIDENILEYMDMYFYRVVSDDKNAGQNLEIPATDAFSAEAYLLPVDAYNDKYIFACTITNLTSDELWVNLSHYFSLCYSSNIVSPVTYGPTDEYKFAPNESKDFVFDVQTALMGDNYDTKEINGSCVLEITNSDKYSYYNVLKIDPYIIETENISDYIPTLGISGKEAYMRREDYYGEHNDEYERHSEAVTDEEMTKLYREQLYPQYGEAIEQCTFVCEYFLVPLYDEKGENVVDYFRIESGVTPILPEDYEYKDWTDTIKLIPLTEERQRTVDISSASPDVLYSDSQNCLFTDGLGGLYLYNFENKELLLAVDFLASMELVNSEIDNEENRYGGASIYSSVTADNDRCIYFSFETKGKEKRGGIFNGRNYYLDVINSKLSISGTSGSLYEAAVTKPVDPTEQPDAISSNLAMINKRDFVYMVNSGTDEGKLPMIRIARNINGNVEYFDPFEKLLTPQERKAPEE
ncbi:MAG: M56 family metallopeptidase [Oscillospiraceae bacterium]